MTAEEHANYSNEWWQELAKELAAERDALLAANADLQREIADLRVSLQHIADAVAQIKR